MKKLLNEKNIIYVFIALSFLFVLSSCSNKTVVDDCLPGDPYGFWNGLWHGIIAPVDLIGMLFRDDVSVFAENNNGAWYAFGFILGSGGWGFLGGKGAKKKNKSNN